MEGLKIASLVVAFFGAILLLIGFDKKNQGFSNLKEKGNISIFFGLFLIIFAILIYYYNYN